MLRSPALSPFRFESTPLCGVIQAPVSAIYVPLNVQFPARFFIIQLFCFRNQGVSYTQPRLNRWRRSRAELARSDRISKKSCGRRGVSTVLERVAVLSSMFLLHVYAPVKRMPIEYRRVT